MDILTRAKEYYRAENNFAPFNNEAAWIVFRAHKKWDVPDPIDLTGDVPSQTNEALFGHDAEAHTIGKKGLRRNKRSRKRQAPGARVPEDLLRRINSWRLCNKSFGQNV
jgi:hypothetical protein